MPSRGVNGPHRSVSLQATAKGFGPASRAMKAPPSKEGATDEPEAMLEAPKEMDSTVVTLDQPVVSMDASSLETAEVAPVTSEDMIEEKPQAGVEVKQEVIIKNLVVERDLPTVEVAASPVVTAAKEDGDTGRASKPTAVPEQEPEPEPEAVMVKEPEPAPEEPESAPEEPSVSAPPPVSASVEEDLMVSVAKEAIELEDRAKQNSLLQSQIQRSVARRKEVEDVIVRELDTLKTRIESEKIEEEARLGQLNLLLSKFEDVIVEKKALLSRESGVLEEMVDLSTKIVENAILRQLEGAISKKKDLITLETELTEEVSTYKLEVQEEIKITESKITRIAELLSSLPRGTDRDAARSYAWLDVEKLEQELLANFDDSVDRSAKLQKLLADFESVLRRRSMVLGEEIKMPNLRAFASSSASTSSALEASEGGGSSSTRKPKKAKREVRPKKETPAFEKTALILRDSSNAEIQKVAFAAVRMASTSIGAALQGVIGSAKRFTTSDEAKESKMALELAGSSINEAAVAVSDAIESMKREWEVAMENPEDEVATDKLVKNTVNAVQNILTSDEVRGNVNRIGTNLKKTSQEVQTAVSVSSSRLAEELESNDSFVEGADGATESVQMLAAAASVAGSRLFEQAKRQMDRGM